MKEISVIIPHYNSFECIYRLLDSIPIDSKIEVIVVDDKSNSDPGALLKLEQYVVQKGWIFIHNQTNGKGAGCARNLGMEAAEGEWLLFADSDDFFLKDTFSCVLAAINTDADIVFFPPTGICTDSDQAATRHLEYAANVKRYLARPDHRNEIRLRYMMGPPWSKLVRRKLITDNRIQFDHTLVSNDLMFSTKAGYYAGAIAADPHCIYCVTQQSGGTLTTSKNAANFETRARVQAAYSSFLRKRLPKDDYDRLPVGSAVFFVRALQGGYGIGEALRVMKMLKGKHVPLGIRSIVLRYLDRVHEDGLCPGTARHLKSVRNREFR